MASLFRGRREESTQNPNESDSASPNPSKWLVGLVSGAGKLISSVFGSADGSGSEDEFDEDDDVVEMLDVDEKDDADKSQRKLPESNQVIIEEPIVISPITQSKAAIEQLLTQETFSREESDKLIQIIQSRVVEPSSRSSPVQPAQEIYSEAILEAKKWLSEKKQSSKPHDLGPCTLNTDTTQFGVESDLDSPIDVAKSYMQSKPPWKSPFLTNNSTLFKTPISPSSGAHKFNDGITLTSPPSFDHSFSSSKGLKRDYVSSEMWDLLKDSSKRIRSRLNQTSSSSKPFETEFVPTEKANEEKLVPEKNGMVEDDTDKHTIKENTEAVVLESPVTHSEKIDEQIASDEALKEPNLVSEPRPSEGDINITNSLHESANKNSTNGIGEKSNMETEFESSTNGGLVSSTGTGTGTVGTGLESDSTPVRKGRKRVVSGRGRGRGSRVAK